MHMAVTVFPLPLSPTRPKISPGSMEKLTLSTAYRLGAALWKWTRREST